MLLSTKATVKWNSRNKKRLCNLGYVFTKMGDPVEVNIEDLSAGSNAIVDIACDYCGDVYSYLWVDYQAKRRRNLIKNDCCKNCCEIKADAAISQKYGSHSGLYTATNEKRKKTNLERFGTENVFASEKIKEAIVEHNLKVYGVPYTQQCEEVREKTIATCRERYGVDNYVELFKGKFIKENSPVWKGGVEYSRVDRATHEYIEWRKEVFSRDHYICQCCGARNGDGKEIILNAHHINNWRDNLDLRYEVDNGITLCTDCHTSFHSIYGKRFNTKEQLVEFINNYQANRYAELTGNETVRAAG